MARTPYLHVRRAAVLLALVASSRAATYNVLNYGAVGDGVTSDTQAVRGALAAAAAANGGTVLLPAPYVFLSGCVNLTSNVELRVEGTLLASPVSAGGNYVLVPPLPWYGGGQDAEMSGAPEWQSVVRAYGATNVSLSGGGVIDGNGGAAGGWWACFHAAPPLGPQPCAGFSRPQLLRLVHTRGVRVALCYPPDTDTPLLALENETKPAVTKALSESTSMVSAEVVGDAICAGLQHYEPHICFGFDGWMLTTLCAGFNAPSGWAQVALEAASMGLWRLVALCVMAGWFSTVRRMQAASKPAAAAAGAGGRAAAAVLLPGGPGAEEKAKAS